MTSRWSGFFTLAFRQIPSHGWASSLSTNALQSKADILLSVTKLVVNALVGEVETTLGSECTPQIGLNGDPNPNICQTKMSGVMML